MIFVEDKKKDEELLEKLQQDVALLNAKKKASRDAMLKEAEKPINPNANTKKGVDLSSIDGNAVAAFIVLLLFLIPIRIPFIYLLFTAGVGTSLLKIAKVIPPHKAKDKPAAKDNAKDSEKFLNLRDIEYYEKLEKKLALEINEKEKQIKYLQARISGNAMADARPTAEQAPEVTPKKEEKNFIL